MQKKIILILSLFLSANSMQIKAQNTLQLKDCINSAMQNYPLIKQKDLIQKSNSLTIKNLNVNYLPQISINGQATYQSDVVSLPIKLPMITIPEADKDNYKVTLDITQTIYDGGSTKALKGIEKANKEVDEVSVEVEMQKIKERVLQLYFNIVLLQQNDSIITVAKSDLEDKIKKLKISQANGIVQNYNVDILRAEYLKVLQQQIDLKYTIKSTIQMLSELTNIVINENDKFEIPVMIINESDTLNNRLELTLFDKQMEKIEFSKSLVNSKNMPRLGAFTQFGYGKPGLNMLSNTWDTYYMVGAKLTWSPWNWNQSSNEKKILSLKKNMVENQKEVFLKNQRSSRYKELADVKKLEEQIEHDVEILKIRENIVKVYNSQLENGVISSFDYVTELNALTQAKLNYQLHNIQAIYNKAIYLNNLNNLK